jgi:hypothetical protein
MPSRDGNKTRNRTVLKFGKTLRALGQGDNYYHAEAGNHGAFVISGFFAATCPIAIAFL